MAKTAAKVWDLKDKKWVYWLAVIGFVLSFSIIVYAVAVVLYFIFDKGKPKTKNYQVTKVYEKYMIVVGLLGILLFVLKMFVL